MKKSAGNFILITGGASGIGLAFASRLVKAGNRVIVCGRREEQLALAKKEVPELITLRADVGTEEERVALFGKISKDFPDVNVLMNNAGIQNHIPPVTEAQDWARYKAEIAINYEAPVHLCLLFTPFLMKKADAAIINVTSGLSFVPMANIMGYSATKAALHSFTLSLRHQLRTSSIKVIEIVPPAVNTDLGGKGLHNFGVPLNEYADYAISCLVKGDLEFGYGFSEKSRMASREQLDEMFKQMNKE